MKSLKSSINTLKTTIPSISLRVSFALCILCFITTGCSLVKSKTDTAKSLESTVIVGTIHGNFSGNGPIIVAARSMDEGKEIAHYTVLHESGEYELMVYQGDYYVFAYWDKNSNLIYDLGEPAGHFDDPKVVSTSTVGVVFDINIIIPDKGQKIEVPHGSRIASVTPQKLQSRQAGAITDLDDERFSEENGTRGFWEPFSFYKELGGNIFFLEEYDPEKIPILFIHGAGGTPNNWRYFIDHLDRTRFQPWVFYYPSGARIDSMSYLLLWKLSNLETKYKFNKMYITAHSMGGLVARSFIVNYGRHLPVVKLFITLATPWGGDRMAEYGVQQSPVVIPSWIDMQPEGDFIKSLYRLNMPEETTFYMFCGHKGNRSPFRTNNDGTIALSSLMDYRPQAEAKMNYAFNEDHESILYSQDVVALYNTVLNEFDEEQSASLDRSGGYLKIHFTYDYDLEDVMHKPTLILRPVGKKDAETITRLTEDDNGKVLGPFPKGDYLASMITLAGKPGKNYVPVSIESNTTKELDFVFRPDGVIRGCFTAALKPEDKVVGMPDYRYREVDRDIEIQSITLKGNGLNRMLKQVKGEDVTDSNYLITRADFSYNLCFGFFGLPAGDYDLNITAKGYKPLEKKYSVVPGKLEYFRATELIPE